MPDTSSLASQTSRSNTSLYIQIFFVVLAFSLMVLSSYWIAGAIARQDHTNAALATLNFSKANLEANLLEPKTVLSTISETIRRMIVDGMPAERVMAHMRSMNDSIKKEQEITGFIGLFGVFDAFGGMFYSANGWVPPEGFDHFSRPWCLAAMKAGGRVATSQPYLNLMAGEYVIAFSRLLTDDRGRTIGVVALDVGLSRIRDAVGAHHSDHGYRIVLDEQLNIISHPDEALWGKNLREQGGLSGLADEFQRGEPILERKVKDSNGETSIAFFQHIHNGWSIGVVTPEHIYFQGIRNMALALGALGLVMASALSVVLIRLSRARRKADERTRIILDAMPLSVHFWARDIKMVYCSQEAVRIFGTSSAEEYLTRFGDLSPALQPDGSVSTAKAAEMVKKAFTEGYCCFDWMHQTLSGEEIPCEVTLVRVEYGRDHMVIAYAKDLREYKARTADAELKKTIITLENILNSSGTMIYATDPETGEILFVNEEMKSHYKITGDVVGRFCYNILQVGQDGICDFCPCHQLKEEPDKRVLWVHQSQVTNRVYSNTDSFIPWPGGRIAHVQHSVDVTELYEAKEKAVRADAAKSKFLATISHEIRTPMNVILGISGIYLQNEALPPEIRKALGKINQSGNMLLGIINDLLDLSKIDAGKMEITTHEYDVPNLINDTVQLNVMRIAGKSITFELAVDEHIPLALYGDELRIKQILNNLLSNAIKYTESGTVKLTMGTTKESDESRVTLSLNVRDTGQGLTPEQISRMFDEYSRFNLETNRTTEGFGLGLNITSKLVQLMQGEIFVESEPGLGSSFTVHLPQRRAGSEVIGRELAENLQRFSHHGELRLVEEAHIAYEPMPYGRVLVVDDMESNLYVAKGIMAPYELRIETADNGLEAIERIKNRETFDVIFMDHMMPVMDGLEAVRIIRNSGYDKPIIALTANAVAGQAELFLANGFDGFLSKPIDLRQLDALLGRLIREKHPREVIEAAQKKYREEPQATGAAPMPAKPHLSEVFVRDAEKAAATMETTYGNKFRRGDDLRLFTINAHGVKTALAYIEEEELSAEAKTLEMAGRENNIELIWEKTPAFLSAIRAIIEKHKPLAAKAAETDEDPAFLREKLSVILAACSEYDNGAIKEALARLRGKTWRRQTNELLNNVTEYLLQSDFEDIQAEVEKALAE